MKIFLEKYLIIIITLVIAGLGGIPGILEIIKHFKNSKLNTLIDEKNSMACFIKSNNKILNSMLVLLLYRITITGEGLIPSYIKEIEVYLKNGKNWVKGENFTPTQYFVKDDKGVGKDSLIVENPDHKGKGMTTFIASWKDFKAGDVKLEYGQPLITSHASAFDIKKEDYDECKKVKIIVKDFIGKKYKIYKDVQFAFNNFNKGFYLYDNIKDVGKKMFL